MSRVTGIGGVFFKSRDAVALREWYRKHLGIDVQSWGGTALSWRDDADPQNGMTVWSVFDDDAKHFKPSSAPFMINYRVADLHALLADLRAEGCAVDDKVDESDEMGKFGWVMDPDGNRVELWEPPASASS